MSLQTWQETLITAQVDGGTLTSAAAASALPAAAKYTLPANFFAIGKQLLVKASGILSTVVTTPGTLRFDVRFGSTVVADSLAIALVTGNAYTSVNWELELQLTCRGIGTAATLMVGGWLSAPNVLGGANAAMPIGGVVANLPWNSGSAVGTSFDSTATQQVDFFFTQTAGTGSMTLKQYALISMN